MNRQFPESYLVVNDFLQKTAVKTPWYGIILHSDTVIESITVAGESFNAADALLLIKDIAVGTPFLMAITKIKLSAGSCKMIKPN